MSAYKAYKICHFVGLKNVTAIVYVFYEKRRLKKDKIITKKNFFPVNEKDCNLPITP